MSNLPNSEPEYVRIILPPDVLHLKSKMSNVSAISMNCCSETCSWRQNS